MEVPLTTCINAGSPILHGDIINTSVQSLYLQSHLHTSEHNTLDSASKVAKSLPLTPSFMFYYLTASFQNKPGNLYRNVKTSLDFAVATDGGGDNGNSVCTVDFIAAKDDGRRRRW